MVNSFLSFISHMKASSMVSSHPTVFLPFLHLLFSISTDANLVQALDNCLLDYLNNFLTSLEACTLSSVIHPDHCIPKHSTLLITFGGSPFSTADFPSMVATSLMKLLSI